MHQLQLLSMSALNTQPNEALLAAIIGEAAGPLLKQFGSLAAIARSLPDELQQVPGIGPGHAQAVQAVFVLARRLREESYPEAPLMDTPERVADLLREDALTHAVERMTVILLNTRRRLIGVENLSDGTLDTLLVHPRSVFRAAVARNAAALVLAHTHPSGDPTPSEQDIKVTRDLIRAGQLMRIDVLDHVILGRRTPDRERDFVSLRELGYFSM